MFIYSFVVLIAQTVDRSRLATAMGWYWAAYSLGIGVLGTYLPSWLLPVLGEQLTLWLALPWVAAGVLLAAWSARRYGGTAAENSEARPRTRPIGCVSWLAAPRSSREPADPGPGHRPRHLQPHAVRLPGDHAAVPGLRPPTTVSASWTVTQWMQLWGLMFAVTIVTNVLWGRIGDRFGWMRQMRWYGCVGCAVATLSFYYLPQWTGPNMVALSAAAVLLAVAVSAFVPMGAVFPALAPGHTGAAVSAHNLAAGVSTFLGPAIAMVLLPVAGVGGVCWAYAVLYLIGAGLTYFVRPDQPGITPAVPAPVAGELAAAAVASPC